MDVDQLYQQSISDPDAIVDQTEGIFEHLRSREFEERVTAARTLRELAAHDESVLQPVFEELVGFLDDDPEIRTHIARAIGLTAPSITPSQLEACHDELRIALVASSAKQRGELLRVYAHLADEHPEYAGQVVEPALELLNMSHSEAGLAASHAGLFFLALAKSNPALIERHLGNLIEGAKTHFAEARRRLLYTVERITLNDPDHEYVSEFVALVNESLESEFSDLRERATVIAGNLVMAYPPRFGHLVGNIVDQLNDKTSDVQFRAAIVCVEVARLHPELLEDPVSLRRRLEEVADRFELAADESVRYEEAIAALEEV